MISREQQFTLVVMLTAVLGLYWLGRRLNRWLRRRRPPQVHPHLQKYQPTDEDLTWRREQALLIRATSSSSTVPGFRVRRQVETVVADGHRNLREALEALKATAAALGANGIVNLRHEAGADQRYTASGDAVLLEEE